MGAGRSGGVLRVALCMRRSGLGLISSRSESVHGDGSRLRFMVAWARGLAAAIQPVLIHLNP